MKNNIKSKTKIICSCMVCNAKWSYEAKDDFKGDDKDMEDLARATCSPCGHQGLFEVEVKKGIENRRNSLTTSHNPNRRK